jgi:hypothetical protein
MVSGTLWKRIPGTEMVEDAMEKREIPWQFDP